MSAFRTIRKLLLISVLTVLCNVFVSIDGYGQPTPANVKVTTAGSSRGKAEHNKVSRRKPVSQRTTTELPLNDSTALLIRGGGGICKSQGFTVAQVSRKAFGIGKENNSVALNTAELTNRTDFVHGDITYDYFYRSVIDTPFTDHDIQQHSVRANIHMLIARQLPVTLQLSTRQANSSLFRNYTDVGLQYDSRAFNSGARDKMAAEVVNKIRSSAPDSLLLKAASQQQQLQEKARQWLEAPAQLQRLAESKNWLNSAGEVSSYLLARKEAMLHDVEDSLQNSEKYTTKQRQGTRLISQGESALKLGKDPKGAFSSFISNNKDIAREALIDSIEKRKQGASEFIDAYNAKQVEFETYKRKGDSLQAAYKVARANTEKKIDEVKNAFANGDASAITEKAKAYGLDSSRTFKWYRRLNALQQFSIGRSIVDYSELSAKNITITGVQAVYEQKIYLAFASGAVDYQYRDFIRRDYQPVKQYLSLVRLGIGRANANNIVFTVYQGKKQGNFYQSNNQPGVNRVFGVTMQSKIRLNDNNYLIAEAAKSSYPATVINNSTVANSNNKTFNFRNHSNEAYSVQLFGRIPSTNTRLYGEYKYLGRNFQSFSIYSINNDFTAWQARIDQYLFKRRLSVTGSLRTNDYNNPYQVSAFKSNTVFKSIQATLRLKKWPVLSVGYMPSSQLTSLNNQVIENRFYTLTGSGSYMYKTAKGYMHTGVLYTKFYNGASDSAFIYYNASNWFIYHNIIGERLSFNSSANVSYNNTYRLITVDQGVNARLSKRLSVGGGLKWNQLNGRENQLGYYGSFQCRIEQLGEFSVSFDSGFVPGVTETLRKNDFGRATYIKTF